ncbi:MAG: hypothetical protein ISS18_13575, partial [Bacteroidales bacterium]|nr:hypothetical protein [Bacteroidales bacterium]
MMKKLIFIFVLLVTFEGAFAQLGSWVLPPYRVDFNNTGPTAVNLQLAYPYNPYTFSAGAFNNNGDLLFYVVDYNIYDANSNIVEAIGSLSGYADEFEIINVPGENLQFYIFYASFPPMGYGNLYYAHIDCSSGDVQVLQKDVTIANIIEQTGIALTKEINNQRYLYVANYTCGINKYLVTSGGISFIENLVDENDPNFYSSDCFYARNLEMNYDETALAWCTTIDYESYLFIVNLDEQGNYISAQTINVNKGDIGGIEFADEENTPIIYISCNSPTYGGIQRYNYNAGVFLSPLTENGAYGNTFLQKSFDGYIYAVSNAGDNFGRIDPLTNTFESNIVSLNVISNYMYTGDITAYKLPENFTYTPFSLTFTKWDESCAWMSDGWIEVFPSGGIPPYTYQWDDPQNQTTAKATGLAPGVYTCTVTDAVNHVKTITVEIVTNPALFNYTGPYEITGSVTWPGNHYKINGMIEIMGGGSLTLINGAKGEFNANSGIIIHDGGSLILFENSQFSGLEACNNNLWSGILVENLGYMKVHSVAIRDCESTVIQGGTLHVDENGVLTVTNDCKITVEEGGYFCKHETAEIVLQDPLSILELQSGFDIGVNPFLNITPVPECADICNINYSGNGVLIMPDLFNYNGPAYITTDTYWTGEDFNIGVNIVIEPNVTLTIDGNSTIEFFEDKGITVKNNARLIINDQTIMAGLTECDNQWTGIKVEDMGYLEINSLTITDCDSEIEPGGSMRLPSGSELFVINNCSFTVFENGYFCENETANLVLQDSQSILELQEGFITGVNPQLNITPAPECVDICNITYSGNGILIMPDLFNYSGPFNISTDTYWTGEDFKIGTNVIINPNTTLTINGFSNIEFFTDKGIIIQDYGRLIINQAIMTGIAECDNQWAGITVEDLGYLEINSLGITGCNSKINNGGTILLPAGADLTIAGECSLTVETGGYFCADETAEIELQDTESTLELEEGYITGVNPDLNIIPTPECADICDIFIWGEGNVYVGSLYWVDELIIDQPITWSNLDVAIKYNLVIEPYGDLLLNNCNFTFTKNSKVIIKPGGKLTMDNSSFDKIDFCLYYSWKGVEIWGNTEQHQFEYNEDGDRYQGMLVMENNSAIINAIDAVRLWKPGDYQSTGGIITADGATFTNNHRAVEFMSYHNFNPVNETPFNNISYFNDCLFEKDDNYTIQGDFYAFITMWDVEGVTIKACSFENSCSPSGGFYQGYGIFSIDAGYSIIADCAEPILPCPEDLILHTTFKGLYAGIEAGNEGSTNTIYVNDAIFQNNSYGIKLNVVDNATIIKSDFFVGTNSKDESECDALFGTGIDIVNCNGYAIEENHFESSEFSQPGTEHIGIRIYYNPDDPGIDEVEYNEIYKNEFINLSVSNQAEEDNYYNNDPYIGLNYLCNTNENNSYDFYVTGEGIRLHQGSQAEAAGNTFSQNGAIQYGDYNNQAIFPVNYNYYTGNPDEEPLYYSDNVYPKETSNQNPCLSHFGGGGTGGDDGRGLTEEEKLAYEQQFTDNLNAYNNVNALYESLKDGGNTEALQTEIVTSWPQDMWELRAELLGKSPHLSKEVLETAAGKTDVLPDAIIFEILSSNPDEMKNKELLTYLEEKADPLPQYMIDLLKALAGNTTYKTILQGQMAHHNALKTRAAYTIIRNALNDTVPGLEDVRNWLDNLQSLAMDYQITDSYLQEGNTIDALALVDMMPQLYNIPPESMESYNRYKTLKQLQAQLITEERNIYQLSADEKAEVEDIAANSTGRAGKQARNILQFVYGNEYCDCPAMPESGFKSSPVSTYELLNDLFEPQVEAYPNPAATWIAFDYRLSVNTEKAVIQISDTKGQVINNILLHGLQGQ